MTIRPKLGVTLILKFIIFLIEPIFCLQYCLYISFTTIIPLYFVYYIHRSTALIFRTLYPRLYEALAKFLCTLWSLALAKKSSNNINNRCASFQTILFLVTMVMMINFFLWCRSLSHVNLSIDLQKGLLLCDRECFNRLCQLLCNWIRMNMIFMNRCS